MLILIISNKPTASMIAIFVLIRTVEVVGTLKITRLQLLMPFLLLDQCGKISLEWELWCNNEIVGAVVQ